MKYPIKILFISPFFAPLSNAEAFCNGKMVNQLLEDGFEVKVLSVDYGGHNKFSYDQSDIWNPLKPVTIKIPPHANTNKYFSPFLGLHYKTINWARWINAVILKVSHLHRIHQFHIIYSRGLPNVAHIAGYWVTRKLGIKWIANFNDPWDLEATHLMPQQRHLRKKNISSFVYDRWFQIVMKKADLITFPCERLRDYHLQMVNSPVNCSIIPHIGVSGNDLSDPKTFYLIHAGSLGSGESTRHGATYELLAGFKRFLDHYPESESYATKLLLVGKSDPLTIHIIKEMKLDTVVSFTGWVNYSESIKYIAKASVCILVEGMMPEGIYLPSKLADYIVSRKPVIALSPTVGTISDLSRFKGITRVNVDDQKSIERAIAFHFEAFKNQQLSTLSPCDELINKFESKNILNNFYSIIKNILPEYKSGHKL
ncbi:MAG: glycosyltransferase [Proteobacteria bacterium]|nr:glycosyltransferase [Pseudomonadota bacterium]